MSSSSQENVHIFISIILLRISEVAKKVGLWVEHAGL
jgi:hypothetical protein